MKLGYRDGKVVSSQMQNKQPSATQPASNHPGAHELVRSNSENTQPFFGTSSFDEISDVHSSDLEPLKKQPSAQIQQERNHSHAQRQHSAPDLHQDQAPHGSEQGNEGFPAPIRGRKDPNTLDLQQQEMLANTPGASHYLMKHIKGDTAPPTYSNPSSVSDLRGHQNASLKQRTSASNEQNGFLQRRGPQPVAQQGLSQNTIHREVHEISRQNSPLHLDYNRDPEAGHHEGFQWTAHMQKSQTQRNQGNVPSVPKRSVQQKHQGHVNGQAQRGPQANTRQADPRQGEVQHQPVNLPSHGRIQQHSVPRGVLGGETTFQLPPQQARSDRQVNQPEVAMQDQPDGMEQSRAGEDADGNDNGRLDYREELENMTFQALRDEPFDYDPRERNSSVQTYREPTDPPAQPSQEHNNLTSQLKAAKEHPEQREKLLNSLTLDEWDQAGDWFLEQFQEVITKFTAVRKEKRKVAMDFEERIAQRHRAIEKKRKATGDALTEMRKNGTWLLNTPKKVKGMD